jgi:hypothetical protein
VCGIAPGSHLLERGSSKWLLGPSSKLLHKILLSLRIYPYFTNIHKAEFDKNNSNSASIDVINKAIRILIEEINILIRTVWKNLDNIYIITLGKYSEYSLFEDSMNSSKITFISTYHPSFYLHKNITSIENPVVQKAIASIRIRMRN